MFVKSQDSPYATAATVLHGADVLPACSTLPPIPPQGVHVTLPRWPFINHGYQIEVMMDVCVARVASILALDLLTLLPSALSINTAAEFIPLSLGVLLVLPHSTTILQNPLMRKVFESAHPIALVIKTGRTKHNSRAAVPSNKTSLISESGPKRHTRHKSRDVSHSSHISYDSKAKARSVRGLLSRLRSGAVKLSPYLLFRMIPSILVPVSDIGPTDILVSEHLRPPFTQLWSPQREEKPLLPPKLFIDTRQSTSNKNSTIVSSDRNLVAHDSDAASSMAPRKPELARHESTRALSYTTSSGASQGFSYIGPDLYHYSMGSQSITYEARDYLAVPAPSNWNDPYIYFWSDYQG
ncbi:hypothetical protein RHS01_01938 [Rhizoctonia solani]|uniref:Uncharacterized protein n=1 Tax=Rhizoctonia solani TaxID=456999 RepID=A0A8H7M8S1_9AGAM|nr:hypothetical protein RHS01_01938 [Rhizoctonia solani]